MKRIIVLALAGVLGLGLFGCGGQQNQAESEAPEDSTTEGSSASTDVGLSGAEKEAYDLLVSRYPNTDSFEVITFGTVVLSVSENSTQSPKHVGETATAWAIKFQDNAVSSFVIFQDGTEFDLSDIINQQNAGTFNVLDYAYEAAGDDPSLDAIPLKMAEITMLMSAVASASESGIDIAALNDALETNYFAGA